MPGFEREVRDFINGDRELRLIEDNTANYGETDFILEISSRFAIEAKEKKGHYRHRWSEISGIPEAHLFAIDETSIKRLFLHFPYFFVIIKDIVTSKIYVLDAFTALCMPRKRLNREIRKTEPLLKGKWIISLSWCEGFSSLSGAFGYIKDMARQGIRDRMGRIDCIRAGSMDDIHLLSGEYGREPGYWEKDVHEK